MRKPKELRTMLEGSVPELLANPERLLVFIDAGSIRHTAVKGLSFQYAYTLNLIVTDFSGHADSIIVPLLAWLRQNQPDLFLNHNNQTDGITFEADLISHSSADISFKIKLTESVYVGVSQDTNTPTTSIATIKHLPEPAIEEYVDIGHWQIIFEDQVISEWGTGATNDIELLNQYTIGQPIRIMAAYKVNGVPTSLSNLTVRGHITNQNGDILAHLSFKKERQTKSPGVFSIIAENTSSFPTGTILFNVEFVNQSGQSESAQQIEITMKASS